MNGNWLGDRVTLRIPSEVRVCRDHFVKNPAISASLGTRPDTTSVSFTTSPGVFIRFQRIINWPVKGIPEQILVSADLMNGDRTDLDRAAAYLLSEVKVQSPSTLRKSAVNKELKRIATGAAAHVAKLRPDERQMSRVIRDLEEWLVAEFYAHHHSAPVWAEIAQHGVVMPGHDTPAAGWLLPTRSDLVEVVDDHITWLGRVYAGSNLQQVSGQFLRCREYPLPVISSRIRSEGVFGEFAPTGLPEIRYLKKMNRR